MFSISIPTRLHWALPMEVTCKLFSAIESHLYGLIFGPSVWRALKVVVQHCVKAESSRSFNGCYIVSAFHPLEGAHFPSTPISITSLKG